jgi:hypothetical protein
MAVRGPPAVHGVTRATMLSGAGIIRARFCCRAQCVTVNVAVRFVLVPPAPCELADSR